jgi:CheY-like chemotaxis protein
MSDRSKIFSILVHLVKNALKYTEKGTIEFGYSLKMYNGSLHLEFLVKDSGIGIPKNRQQAIFDRFVQADIADSRAYQGAGLGLSISKAYAEMLGGNLSVHSEDGMGSTFFLTIPYNPINKNAIEINQKNFPSETVSYPIKKLKVLIAEDDETTVMFLSLLLRKYSNMILTAQNGIEAVEIYRNTPDIDLIMMDMKMPLMDGFEATRQIRKLNKDVVIIAQTAYGLMGDKEKTLEAGCNDYIAKPVDISQLMEILSMHFSK